MTKRGRPSGRNQDKAINLRASAELIARIDAWAGSQEDRPSRAEAIRRLLERALSQN
jgi:hypothetical protein